MTKPKPVYADLHTTKWGAFSATEVNGDGVECKTNRCSSSLGDLTKTLVPLLIDEPGCRMNTAGDGTTVDLAAPEIDVDPAVHVCLSWGVMQAQYECTDQVIFDCLIIGSDPSAACKDHVRAHTQSTGMLSLVLYVEGNTTIHGALHDLEHRLLEIRKTKDVELKPPPSSSSRTLLIVDKTSDLFRTRVTSDILRSHDGIRGCYTSIAVCLLAARSCRVHVLRGASLCAEVSSRRIERRLAHILGRVHDKPEAPISDLMGLAPCDLADLRRWNGKLPPPVDSCVHEIIERRALDRPNALAVSTREGDLTYRELWSLAQRLARCLRSRGVGPNVFVPLCFHKSQWTIVAILGVLMSGGAFVLLEPAYPIAVLSSICANLRPPLIICCRTTAETSKQLAPEALVLHGDHCPVLSEACSHIELPKVNPADAAYAAFTSGSTGTPKGVVIEHRAYCTGAAAHIEQFKMGPSSRVLEFASYAFDITMTECLSTLMAGGCLCILHEDQRSDSFVESARALKPTHAFLTPSFVRSLKPSDFSSIALETLVMIGERIGKKELACCPPELTVMNGYGPAECSPITTVHHNLPQASQPANIGWSRCGACWVVDPQDHNRLVPVGAIGELVIQGGHVGRGYLNDQSQTEAAFIKPPAWLSEMQEGEPLRLYKTGDLVRCLEDGSLVCVGRKGSQVKLRGQRLELEDIEAHSRRWFPDAADVVAEVLVPAQEGKDPFLTLSVVVQATSEEQSKRLRPSMPFLLPTGEFFRASKRAQEGLAKTLPKFMVPTLFLPLSELPRTVSGKRDRKRLQEDLGSLSAEEIGLFVFRGAKSEPSSAWEAKLRDIWASELHISPQDIGRDDDFFDLGGNSISAMRVAARSRASGISLAASDLLERPTLALLSPHLAASSTVVVDTTPFTLFSGEDEVDEGLISKLREEGIIPAGATAVDMLPLTRYQCEMLDTGGLDCFQFYYPGVICEKRLRLACEAIWARYSILRTVFVPRSGGFVQIELSHADLRFRHIRTADDVQSVATSLSQEDCQRSSVGPLASHFTLVSRLDQQEHVFTICLSHLHYDGVSLHFLLEDISRVYHGESTVPRPRFFEYMYFRAQHEQGPAISFWRDYLAGCPWTNLLEIYRPGDEHPKPGMDWSPMQEVTLPIPAIPKGITLATLVRAAWSLTLAEFYQQRDVVFQQTVHGRDSACPGIDRIFGPCINKLPFRVTIQAGCSVLQFLHHIQEQHARTLRFDYVDMTDVIARCTPWPDNARMSWHLLHQNFDENFQCPLDGLAGSGKAIDKGRPPKSESGIGVCSIVGNDLKLALAAVCTPDTMDRTRAMVARWAELVTALSGGVCGPLTAVSQLL